MKQITVFEDDREFDNFVKKLASRIHRGKVSVDDACIELEDRGFKLDDVDTDYIVYTYPYGPEGYFIHFAYKRAEDDRTTDISWGNAKDGITGGDVTIPV